MKKDNYEGTIESIAKSLLRDKKGISILLTKNLKATDDIYSLLYHNEDILVTVKFIKKGDD